MYGLVIGVCEALKQFIDYLWSDDTPIIPLPDGRIENFKSNQLFFHGGWEPQVVCNMSNGQTSIRYFQQKIDWKTVESWALPFWKWKDMCAKQSKKSSKAIHPNLSHLQSFWTAQCARSHWMEKPCSALMICNIFCLPPLQDAARPKIQIQIQMQMYKATDLQHTLPLTSAWWLTKRP